MRPDLLARSDNRLTRARHTTRDADILCLRWLYLDIDPAAPRRNQQHRGRAGRGDRNGATRSWATTPSSRPSAAWGCSGNGAWILVRLPDYPNDPHHAALLARALATLDQKYSDNTVRIDTATANPARLIGLPGTLKAKGCNRPERPWRRVTLDGIGTRTLTMNVNPVGPKADDFARVTHNLLRRANPRTARLRDGSTATEALPNYGQFSQEPRVREPATADLARRPFLRLP